MKHSATLIALLSGLLIALPAIAAKPEWAGKGGGKDKGESRQEDRRDNDRAGNDGHREGSPRFEDRHREAIRDYYGAQFERGRCPPGLAKKNNGCMPPGQAKKWKVGRPLPRDVIYYTVPDDLVVRIGRPLPGYKYVRVASDILLIAVGTGMIMDAIQDLGR
jgi:Ni/Co efflux regulator RcnB